MKTSINSNNISSYQTTLKHILLDNSASSTWETAVNEWEIIKSSEDTSQNSSCICGKESIKYLYTIKNSINNNILEPIGSSCIKKFGREDLKEFTEVKEQLFKLLNAYENKEIEIEFSSEFFSRKLFKKIFDDGFFKPNKYNNFDGENDYDFLIKMFNKRKKENITEKQWWKINKLFETVISIFLENEIKNNL